MELGLVIKHGKINLALIDRPEKRLAINLLIIVLIGLVEIIPV